MSGVTLFVYMIAFALGCMCLALAVVYQIQNPHQWTRYFIICISSLLGCMMLDDLQLMTSILLKDGLASRVFSTVIGAIFVGNVVFLVSFIPYFTTWVIKDSWHNPYKTFFLLLSCVYAVFGVLNLVSPHLWYSNLMDVLFVCVLGFCFCVLLKNLESIEEKGVRAVCITLMIISVSILPAIGLTLLFPSLRTLMYGVYFLAFSIAVMVYLFIYFLHNKKTPIAERKELTLDDLAQFHITERELSVIKLVAKGMTNKEIAVALDISVNTVNNHVANIFTKTKVRSRIDLLNLLKQLW